MHEERLCENTPPKNTWKLYPLSSAPLNKQRKTTLGDLPKHTQHHATYSNLSKAQSPQTVMASKRISLGAPDKKSLGRMPGWADQTWCAKLYHAIFYQHVGTWHLGQTEVWATLATGEAASIHKYACLHSDRMRWFPLQNISQTHIITSVYVYVLKTNIYIYIITYDVNIYPGLNFT